MEIRLKSSVNEDVIHSFSNSTHVELNNEQYFELKNLDLNQVIRIKCPFKAQQIEYTTTLYLFKNRFLTQNDVIELRIKEKQSSNGRIGYIFSLSALTDLDNIVFNEHSLPFAYSAFENLVKGKASVDPLIPTLKEEANYLLHEFYDEDIVILAVCDQLIEQVQNYSFYSYLYDLANYGFVYISDQRKQINYNTCEFIDLQYASIKETRNLKLKKHSSLILDVKYLEVLFKELISQNNHSLTKFHILYQVIELLIDYVLKELIKSHIGVGDDNVSGFKIKEKLKEISSEGYRVRRLLNDFSQIPLWLNDELVVMLKSFLTPLNLINEEGGDTNDENTKLPKLLSKFRNNLVHNYRVIHYSDNNLTSYLEQLEKINNHLQILVTSLILTFQHPKD